MKIKDISPENRPRERLKENETKFLSKLPIFEGYTVDVRLKQFRKVKKQKIDFIDFKSRKGKEILNRYIKSLNSKSGEFKKFAHHF